MLASTKKKPWYLSTWLLKFFLYLTFMPLSLRDDKDQILDTEEKQVENSIIVVHVLIKNKVNTTCGK